MTPPKEQIHQIPLDQITPPAEDVRQSITPDALHELAASMAALGQLSPICLRRADQPPYEIQYGHRRYLAARLLGWKTIKAIFTDSDDSTNYLARAAENLIREDLSVLEEAEVYRRLHDEKGLTIREIAQRIGRSEMHIQRTLKALELPDYAKEALHKKEITFSALLPLMAIDDDDTRDYYMRYAIQNGATQAVTRNWAATYKAAKAQKIQESPALIINTQERKRIVYIPCEACQNPTDIETMKHIHLCPTCHAYITGEAEIEQTPTQEASSGNPSQAGH